MPLHRRLIAFGNVTLHIGRHADTLVCSQMSSLWAGITKENSTMMSECMPEPAPTKPGWEPQHCPPWRYQWREAFPAQILKLQDSTCKSREWNTSVLVSTIIHRENSLPTSSQSTAWAVSQEHGQQYILLQVHWLSSTMALAFGFSSPGVHWMPFCQQESSKWKEKSHFSFALPCWPPLPPAQ